MSTVAAEYVERTAEGGWRVAGSRVSLDSVVQAYWEGKSPEAIVEEFPSLTAEQVYGVVAFYLRHKREIDQHLVRQASRWEELQESSEACHGPLLERIRRARKPIVGSEHAS